MQFTARQRKFMELASRMDGFCPYDPPHRAPILKSAEINPLIDADLVRFDEDNDVWRATRAGKDQLAAQSAA